MNQRVPWLRVVTEGVVIVFSILLAFAIDAGWDGMQDRRRDSQFREALSRDMQRSLDEIDQVVEVHTLISAVAETFLAHSSAELSALPADSAQRLFDRLHVARTFSPFDAALRGYDVTSLSDHRLRAALADWSMLLDRAQRSNPYVVEGALGMLAAGRDDPAYWEIEGSWADILAHMRRSPSFMSAASVRGTTSSVARAQLLELRESTVELLALLPRATAR
jgi:hypothetical protein